MSKWQCKNCKGYRYEYEPCAGFLTEDFAGNCHPFAEKALTEAIKELPLFIAFTAGCFGHGWTPFVIVLILSIFIWSKET